MVDRLPCFRAARREREALLASNVVLARQQADTQEEVRSLKVIVNQNAIRAEERLDRIVYLLEVEGGKENPKRWSVCCTNQHRCTWGGGREAASGGGKEDSSRRVSKDGIYIKNNGRELQLCGSYLTLLNSLSLLYLIICLGKTISTRYYTFVYT